MQVRDDKQSHCTPNKQNLSFFRNVEPEDPDAAVPQRGAADPERPVEPNRAVRIPLVQDWRPDH